MAVIHFAVTEDCIRLGLRAGAIVLRGVRVSAAGPELRGEIRREVEAIRRRLDSPAAVRALPEVNAFRALLRKAGADPRKDQPSVERLLTYAFKRGDLPAINNLVDAYNLVSVRSLCSLGAHDLDRIAPPVSLRLLTGAESFTPLGRDAEVPVTAGEYGYVDARGRLLCRWDVVQAEFSKVTADTTNALVIVEATAMHAPEGVRQTFNQVADLVTRICGGTVEVIASPVG
jgi:DNA/RNA-binding domain of Phe-tRNA-synthetase-like protein